MGLSWELCCWFFSVLRWFKSSSNIVFISIFIVIIFKFIHLYFWILLVLRLIWKADLMQLQTGWHPVT